MNKGINGSINTTILKNYMEHECISIRGFCKRCSISPKTFHALEQGNPCRATTVVKICFATGFTLEDLIVPNKKDEN